jgi:hypothetical protein
MVRFWAWSGLVAQIVFVASWLVAAAWQGPGYSPLAHSISDMYAVTAPKGLFLVIVLTVCGIATIGFAAFSLRPALRPAGWLATVTSVLLGLSILGIGDALSPFEREGCRLADSGCTAQDQMARGGAVDAILSTLGIFVFVATVFVAASAMRRTPGWEDLAGPARWFGGAFVLLILVLIVADSVDLGGLIERVLAASGAAATAIVAARVLRQPTASETADRVLKRPATTA